MTIKLEDIKAGAKFVNDDGRVFRILQLMHEEEYFLAQDGYWFVMEAIPKNKEEMVKDLNRRGCKLVVYALPVKLESFTGIMPAPLCLAPLGT